MPHVHIHGSHSYLMVPLEEAVISIFINVHILKITALNMLPSSVLLHHTCTYKVSGPSSYYLFFFHFPLLKDHGL